VQTQSASAPEAKLSAELAARLGLSGDDVPYAVYSPLQVFFTVETGFFLPHREPWHAYVGRCVAARDAAASFQAEERPDALLLTYQSPGLRVELQLAEHGFDLSADGSAALLNDLRKFCASDAMPEGIHAAVDGEAVRIRARAA
jgi:hypothetical protein